jgi:hypothetical protein
MLVLAALVVGLLLGVAVMAVVVRAERLAHTAHKTDLQAVIAHERGRVVELTAMLDQVRARALEIAPPTSATVGPALTPLPDEIQQELDALDDEQARAEFEAVIRAQWERHPDQSPRELLAAVMP